jgi:hypothetical protein
VSGEEEFVVQHAQRMNRYVIQDRTSSDQEFLLYTTQSLRPGDVVTIKSQPIWRNYTPELCVLLCRQSRQVLDNG